MGFLFGSKERRPDPEAMQARIGALESELGEAKGALADIQELARHLEGEWELVLQGVERLRPGMSPQLLAETLLELTFRPMDLASFFVATVDWEREVMPFVAYHEGGRMRHPAPRNFQSEGGLTARAILSEKPLYVRTLEEARALGAVFSEAERVSGLIPQSWYGVPLLAGGRPFGLVAFQSFQQDAFNEARLRVFDALAALLARAMALTDPSLEQRP